MVCNPTPCPFPSVHCSVHEHHVWHRYGNNSSTSFLFAFDEMLQKPPCAIQLGDLGTFITMGPGAGLELCLWSAGPRAAGSSAPPLSGWEPAKLDPGETPSRVRRIEDPPEVAAAAAAGVAARGGGKSEAGQEGGLGDQLSEYSFINQLSVS